MLPVVIVVNGHMLVSIVLAGFFRFVKFTENIEWVLSRFSTPS